MSYAHIHAQQLWHRYSYRGKAIDFAFPYIDVRSVVDTKNVLVKNNLTWSDHIAGICSKSKQILGMLYRQFYNNSSPETLKQLQLYLSLVRPHLEYSCQLWDPYTQMDIN